MKHLLLEEMVPLEADPSASLSRHLPAKFFVLIFMRAVDAGSRIDALCYGRCFERASSAIVPVGVNWCRVPAAPDLAVQACSLVPDTETTTWRTAANFRSTN